MRSTATKAPVGLWLARGSQRLGMFTVVAAVLTRTRNRRNTAARRRRIAPDEGVFRRNSAILRPHQSPAVTASPDRGKPSGTANFAIHPATLPLLKPSPLGGKVAATKGSRRMRGTDKQQQKVRPHPSPAVTDSPRPGEAFILNTTCQFMDKKARQGNTFRCSSAGFFCIFPQIFDLKW